MPEQAPQRSLKDEPTCYYCFPLLGGCLTLGYVNLIYTVIQTITRFYSFSNTVLSNPHYKYLFMVSLVVLNGIWFCINIACLANLHMKKRGPSCFYIFAVLIDRALYVADGITYIMMVKMVTNNLLVFRSLDLLLPIHFIYNFHKCMKRLANDWETDDDVPAPRPATVETYARSDL